MADLESALDGLVAAVLAAVRDRPSVLFAGLLALVAVTWTVSWRLTRGVVTIAHEGGHALVAVLTGRGLHGIRLHADSSGLTTSSGHAAGVGLVLTFLGGYPAPAALGLAGALLVATGRAAVTLWLVIGLLVLTLTQVRNAFGVVSVLATAGLVAAVAWWGDADLQAGFAAALVWFLLFGGLRAVRELQRGRRRGPRLGGESDADALARLTGVPGGMWAGLFWLLGTAAVITGAWVLVGEGRMTQDAEQWNAWNRKVIDEFRENGGKVGGQFEGAPMILVHHFGARSGTERVTPLVYFPDGDRYLVVASKAGAPTNPDWYHNLKAHPRVDVEVGTETFAVAVEELADTERADKWAAITAANPGFGEYQEKTPRTIPVLALSRV